MSSIVLSMQSGEPVASSRQIADNFEKRHDHVMKQTELIQAVQSDTGLLLDDSYLYKILRGERKPEKIIQSICKILEIKKKEE